MALINGATLTISKEQMIEIIKNWLEDNNFCIYADVISFEWDEDQAGWSIDFREKPMEDE